MLMLSLLWSGPSHARYSSAPTPTQRAERLIEEGDAARDKGNHEEAANKYRAAYYSLPLADRMSFIGSLAVRSAMTAFQHVHEAKPDDLVLERQIVLATEFLVSVDALGSGATAVDAADVEEVEKARASAKEKLPASEGTSETCPPASKAPVDVAADETDDRKKDPPLTRIEPVRNERKPNWLGIGLLAGGGVAAGVGAGILAGWWTVRREASNYVELAPGYEEGTEARASYLAQQEEQAQTFRIAGAVLVSVGAAAAAGGLVYVLLRRGGDKQSKPQTAMVPSVGFHGAGVVLSRRF
jgi:hypothetical protein